MPKTFYQITKNEKYTIKNKKIRKTIYKRKRKKKQKVKIKELKDKNKKLKNLTNNY